MTSKESQYPQQLKDLEDRPETLYVKGDCDVLSTPCISVVGTRNMTAYGKFVTQRFVEDLVLCGFTIVSGLAVGVDGQAHQKTLDCGGKTIAVLAHGLDRVSPVEHHCLAGDILASGGALVSEFPGGFAPRKYSFIRRNRIIAGLSLGVLITEAGEKSGTKITASFAAQYGRPVFAVPGPITSQFSEGTKQLVNLGAKLVTKVEDILEEIPPLFVQGQINAKNINMLPGVGGGRQPSQKTEKERGVLKALQSGKGGATPNSLSVYTKNSISEVQQLLLELELSGAVKKIGAEYVVS